MITLFAAAAHGAACSILFVASLYMLPGRVRAQPRDAPEHIKWRMFALSLPLIASPLLTLFVLHGTSITGDALSLFGIAPRCFTAAAVLAPLAFVALLFSGPLLQLLCAVRSEARQGGTNLRPSAASWLSALLTVLDMRDTPPLQLARTLFVAPVAEEWVFRACVLPVAVAAGASTGGVLLYAALPFGLAHLHHAYELWRRGGASAARVAAQVTLQFSYTSAFGAIAAYLLLQSGNMLSVVIAHAFCNMIGLPDIGWVADFFSSDESPQHALRRERWLLSAAYLAGVAAFVWALLLIDARGPCALAAAPG